MLWVGTYQNGLIKVMLINTHNMSFWRNRLRLLSYMGLITLLFNCVSRLQRHDFDVFCFFPSWKQLVAAEPHHKRKGGLTCISMLNTNLIILFHWLDQYLSSVFKAFMGLYTMWVKKKGSEGTAICTVKHELLLFTWHIPCAHHLATPHPPPCPFRGDLIKFWNF